MRLCGRGRRISHCVGVNLSLLLLWRHMWTADNSTDWSMAVSAATCGSFQHSDRVCLNILPQSLCKSRHKLVIKVQRHRKSRKDSRFSGVCAYTAYIILFAWFLPPISIPEFRRIDRRHCIVVKWHFIHVICWQSQIHKYLISIRCTCMCIRFELEKKKKWVSTKRLWELFKILDICAKLTWRTLWRPFHCCSERHICNMRSHHTYMCEQATVPSPSNRFSLPKCRTGAQYNRGARLPFLVS